MLEKASFEGVRGSDLCVSWIRAEYRVHSIVEAQAIAKLIEARGLKPGMLVMIARASKGVARLLLANLSNFWRYVAIVIRAQFCAKLGQGAAEVA